MSVRDTVHVVPKDGNVDKDSCLNTEQPLGISGHRLVLVLSSGGDKLDSCFQISRNVDAWLLLRSVWLCAPEISGNTDYTEPQTILEVPKDALLVLQALSAD